MMNKSGGRIVILNTPQRIQIASFFAIAGELTPNPLKGELERSKLACVVKINTLCSMPSEFIHGFIHSNVSGAGSAYIEVGGVDST
jgi:hypothetical protein